MSYVNWFFFRLAHTSSTTLFAPSCALLQWRRRQTADFGVERWTLSVERLLVLASFQIRRATAHDAAIIAWHRSRMFQDMGRISGAAFEILRAKAQTRLEEWLTSGDYVGWLATPGDQPELVVGGAGVQLQRILPRPVDKATIGEGRQGTIVNVFTEPEWRRRGIAGLLMKEIIAWSKTEKIDRLILHASDDGRPVYEKLGFKESNEMLLRDNS
jgi:GNAT superfamily N-acetyltransferase